MINIPLLSSKSRLFKMAAFIATLLLALSCNQISSIPTPSAEPPMPSPAPTQVTRVSLNLPDTSGTELIGRIRQGSPFAEVVIITGAPTALRVISARVAPPPWAAR